MSANPYGPVTTTDSTQLTDDDWQLQLPPIKYTRYPGTDRLKSIIYELRQNHRNLTIAVTGICVLLLISMGIVLVVSHNPKKCLTNVDEVWQISDQGLDFYPAPEDKSVLISFDPNDFHKVPAHPIKQSLDEVLVNYSTITQLNETVFVDCNSTYQPMDKTCRVSRSMFGDICTSTRNYGYLGGQPCVFIQLSLPDGVTIKPILEESPLWETDLPELSDASHVPISCDGTTSSDRDILSSVKGYGPKGETIMYFPKEGLQSYIYRPRNDNLPFLKPGVMVQFTSLVSRQIIHVTCVAWGQLYDAQDKLIDHDLLSTQFSLFVNNE